MSREPADARAWRASGGSRGNRSGGKRRGYAEDAVRILLRYGFWERRYQKCNSTCAHTKASIALHTKLGFLEEGRRRRQAFYDGGYHDDILFGMLREEFDEQEMVGRSRHNGEP